MVFTLSPFSPVNFRRAIVPISVMKLLVPHGPPLNFHITWALNCGRMRHATFALVVTAAVLASAQLTAQWVNHPTQGVPRRADGKVDMAAPAPRMANGR